jgi:hypothetical protein
MLAQFERAGPETAHDSQITVNAGRAVGRFGVVAQRSSGSSDFSGVWRRVRRRVGRARGTPMYVGIQQIGSGYLSGSRCSLDSPWPSFLGPSPPQDRERDSFWFLPHAVGEVPSW